MNRVESCPRTLIRRPAPCYGPNGERRTLAGGVGDPDCTSYGARDDSNPCRMSDAAARHDAARRALDGLRDRYRASSGVTLALFGTIAEQLAAVPDDEGLVSQLVRELHRVRGTAGSFGFADACRLAADFEARAQQWAGDPQYERGARSGAVRGFAAALRDTLA